MQKKLSAHLNILFTQFRDTPEDYFDSLSASDLYIGVLRKTYASYKVFLQRAEQDYALAYMLLNNGYTSMELDV